MKLQGLKADEFLRVILTAALLVIVTRLVLDYTNTGVWVQQAWVEGQERASDLIDNLQSLSRDQAEQARARESAGVAPTNTPNAVLEANQSVVMLTGNPSIGSGIILTSNGLVLTNSHVIRNGGDEWTVQFANGAERSARVIATGNRQDGIFYDLALVQVEGVSNLPIARFSEAPPQAGEQVWAVGAPYGQPKVVTQGEIKKLTIDGILLSSTEVHPGNSGGPLLNQSGEVIGINTEINPSLPAGATTASISVSVLERYLPQLANQ